MAIKHFSILSDSWGLNSTNHRQFSMSVTQTNDNSDDNNYNNWCYSKPRPASHYYMVLPTVSGIFCVE